MADKIAPVRKADRGDLHAEVAAARAALNGWGDRLSVTRGSRDVSGRDLAWLLRQVDAATSRLSDLVVAIEIIYPETKTEDRP